MTAHDIAQGWHDDLRAGGMAPGTIVLFCIGSAYCAYGDAARLVFLATGWPVASIAVVGGTRRVCRIPAGALEDAVLRLKERGYRVLTGTVG